MKILCYYDLPGIKFREVSKLRSNPNIREEPGLVVLPTAFPTSLKFKIYIFLIPRGIPSGNKLIKTIRYPSM